LRYREFSKLPAVSIVATSIDGQHELLAEGQWIDGRYENNIRIDRDTHFSNAGPDNRHAHVYGRTDRSQALVAVRQSGEASHALKGILHKKDVAALRAKGFNIPMSGIIEWVELPPDPDVMMLLENL